MSERALELNQIVVTGTAGGAEKRELGTSVSAVNAADVMAQTSVPSVDALLNGRAPGVVVLPGSGQVGAGAIIRVRGVGTFSLSNQPLIYVDGIRSDNGQTGLVQRFDDFDPEQIESIEVLKGPAAATLYGTEAARGVINIITKKGAAGSNKYTFTARDGDQWFMDAAEPHADQLRDQSEHRPIGFDQLREERSRARAIRCSARALNQGFDAKRERRVEPLSLLRRRPVGQRARHRDRRTRRTQKSARTNLSVSPNSKFDLETNVGYITSHTNVTPEGSGGGVFFTGEYAEPQRTARHSARRRRRVAAACRAGRSATRRKSIWRRSRGRTCSASRAACRPSGIRSRGCRIDCSSELTTRSKTSSRTCRTRPTRSSCSSSARASTDRAPKRRSRPGSTRTTTPAPRTSTSRQRCCRRVPSARSTTRTRRRR